MNKLYKFFLGILAVVIVLFSFKSSLNKELKGKDNNTISGENVVKTVYDQTMGTSQMLSAMIERIKEMNQDADVITFGQEFNPETYAIAKADTMIRGGNPKNMILGSTLSKDGFGGLTFDYCISNPPFGIDWKKEQKKVN